MGATDLAPNPALEAQKRLSLEAAFEEAVFQSVVINELSYPEPEEVVIDSAFQYPVDSDIAALTRRLQSLEQRVVELESRTCHCSKPDASLP